MSGIVGYIGPRRAVPILLEALRRLEYRGYDSAGLAVYGTDGQLAVRRASGKLRQLEEVIRLQPVEGIYGIGHTRWATHGRPTAENAHPHCDCRRNLMVVHNGIIENYAALRQSLAAEGHVFRTETDTEVIAHLIEKHLEGSLEEAVRRAALELTGLFAVAVIARSVPHTIVVARSGPPAVIGLGEGEYFVASDVPAILNYTRDVIFLADGDLAVLTPDGVRLSSFDGSPVKRRLVHVLWDPILAEKGGYPHFTLKEIFEQPRAVRDTLQGRLEPESGRIRLDEVDIPAREFREFQQVRLVACGSSWHAALAGKFMLEELARIPVEVDYGSEFRYRDPILGPGVLTVAVTQSGETADTLAALREARQKGSPTLAISNALGSMVTREAAGTLLTHAGPEIGVVSTKAFTSELAALLLLAMYLGQARQTLEADASRRLAQRLLDLPGQVEQVLSQDAAYQELARRLARATDVLFLGRGVHYPIALEGALKLKELGYIHAEGYPAGEMKHGPNALIDGNFPVIVLAAYDRERSRSRVLYEKTLANIEEVKAREGLVVALANPGDEEVSRAADYVLEVPSTHELLAPILEVVPLQLLAYHLGVRRGCDVDQPRNLAKSVTVE